MVGGSEQNGLGVFAQYTDLYQYTSISVALHLDGDYITPMTGVGLSFADNNINFIFSFGIRTNYREFRLTSDGIEYDQGAVSFLTMYQITAPFFKTNTPLSFAYTRDTIKGGYGVMVGITVPIK